MISMDSAELLNYLNGQCTPQEEKEIISLQKISYLEQKLPEDLFMRIHRSFIVPVKKIEAFSNHAVEVGGKELPIGRNYKNQVLEILNNDSSILD